MAHTLSLQFECNENDDEIELAIWKSSEKSLPTQ